MNDIEKKLNQADQIRNQKMSERDALIQSAIEGPTYHVFSDYDNSAQGGKAIAQGIANNQGGKASYDYTRSAGANLAWPDLDPSSVGTLEPWLCYFADGRGGWIDLNATPSGKERRAHAAYRELGLNDHPQFQRVDDQAKQLISQLSLMSDSQFDASAPQYGFKRNSRFAYRDHFLGMQLEFQDLERRANKKGQQALDAANAWQKQEMDGHVAVAKTGGLLDPVEGITIEDWAAANAKIVSGMELSAVLNVLKLEKPVWDAVSAEWNGRMSRDTTFAIATTYGAAFTNSNIGKFAATANAAPAAGGGVGLQKTLADFEEYVKIMCHQSAAAGQGIDAVSVLKKYGLTITDWSTIGMHWGGKISSGMSLAMRMGDLMAKYGAQFASPGASSDIDF